LAGGALGITWLNHFPNLTISRDGIIAKRFFRTKLYRWQDFIQAGVNWYHNRGLYFHEIVLLLPGGSRRKKYDSLFFLRNVFHILYLPYRDDVFTYVLQGYGKLDFCFLNGSEAEDYYTIEEQKEKLTKLEGEKTELENQVTKIKSQIDELNSEITSLKDEVSTAKDETEAAKEETAKAQKLVEQLKKLLQESIQTRGAASSGSGAAVTTLPVGDKGKIIEADNKDMFAVVEFTDEAMKELKGENLDKPLPAMELSVKRPGFKGAAGEFVGRIRLRQEVKGKNYVICDILGAWEQDKLSANDVIFAD
jgi:outer membrane murein-binding lipoprotein Lpp